MALQAMVKVFDSCPEKGGEYMVLTQIASLARDADARDVWFRLDRMAHRCRMTIRNLRLVLAALVRKGRLVVAEAAGPHGYDAYSIVFPAKPFGPAEYQTAVQARVAGKRALGKTALGRRKSASAPAKSERFSPPRLPTFFCLDAARFSLIREKFSLWCENFSPKIAVPASLGAEIPTPNSLLTRFFLTVVYTEFAGDARARGALLGKRNGTTTEDGEETPEALHDHEPEARGEKHDAPQAGRETPALRAAGADAPDEDTPPWSDEPPASPEADVRSPTDLEKVPAAGRADVLLGREEDAAATWQLERWFGFDGSVPRLRKTYLHEIPAGLGWLATRVPEPRRLWLRLSVAEVRGADARAHERADKGEGAWRTMLADELDRLLGGGRKKQDASPVPPSAAPAKPLDVVEEGSRWRSRKSGREYVVTYASMPHANSGGCFEVEGVNHSWTHGEFVTLFERVTTNDAPPPPSVIRQTSGARP